jgi:hypothetical protein
VSSWSRVTPRSRTTDEKVRSGKAAARAAMSNLASCWRVPNQMNWVLEGLSRSRFDDIQAPKAPMIELIARVAATESEAEQCK